MESFSPIPLWIQNIYLRVIEVARLRQSTFPYFGEGAPGPEPILGYVELEPEPGLYRVNTTKQAKLGQGIDKDEYRIRVYSKSGYRYRIGITVDWTDTVRKQHEGQYAFDEEEQLDFPELLQWVDLVQGSKEVKILFYHFFQLLVEQLKTLAPPTTCTILVSSPHADQRLWEDTIADVELGENIKNIGLIPDGDEQILAELAGSVYGRLRNFIVADGRLLILQNGKDLYRADIIEDPKRIAAIEQAYDILAERVIQRQT